MLSRFFCGMKKLVRKFCFFVIVEDDNCWYYVIINFLYFSKANLKFATISILKMLWGKYCNDHQDKDCIQAVKYQLQSYSHVSNSSYLRMKCIRNNSLLGRRSFGFLFNMQRINYWNSDETFFPFGKRTYYVNYTSTKKYYLIQILLLVYVKGRTTK